MTTKEQKEPNPLFKWIWNRIHKRNKNCLILILGATGSGKSFCGLRVAELLSKGKFSILNLFFRAIQVMTRINSKKLVRGDVLLWDEVGVEHDAKRFMSISNRVINYFFQTSRHLGLIFIMTLPLASMIDSSTRKLAHIIIQTEKIDMQKKRCLVKVFIKQTNPLTSKEYHKLFRYSKNGKQYKLKRLWVNLPPKELIDQYEEQKEAFTTTLNEDILRQLEGEKAKEQSKKELTEIQEDYAKALTKMSIEEVAKEKGVTTQALYGTITAIKKKGYKIKPIRSNNSVIHYEIEGLN